MVGRRVDVGDADGGFGAGAMALEVGAKVSDGLALIVKMIAPYLDWIVNKISELVGG